MAHQFLNAVLNTRHAIRIVPIVVLVNLSSNVQSAQYQYGVKASLVYYDNINRIPEPVSDELVQVITGEYNVSENTANVLANFDSTINSATYKNGQNRDDLTGKLSGKLLWIISPRQFEWYTSDIYTQILINPLSNNTQSNRQNVNVFLTGPNYFLRLNSRNNINFEARFTAVNFENGIGDNQRTLSAVRWLYFLGPTVTTSINSEFENTEFKENTRDNIARSDVFAGIEYIRGTNSIIAEAGNTELDFETQKDFSLPRYKLSIKNQRTRLTDIKLEYTDVVSDAGRSLVSSVPVGGSNVDKSVSSNAEIFKNKRFTFTLNSEMNLGNISFTFYKNEKIYDNEPDLDRNRDGTLLQFNHYFGRTSILGINAAHLETFYLKSATQRRDLDDYFKISYTYVSSIYLQLKVSAEKVKRESTEKSRTFEGNKILFSVSYFMQ